MLCWRKSSDIICMLMWHHHVMLEEVKWHHLYVDVTSCYVGESQVMSFVCWCDIIMLCWRKSSDVICMLMWHHHVMLEEVKWHHLYVDVTSSCYVGGSQVTSFVCWCDIIMLCWQKSSEIICMLMWHHNVMLEEVNWLHLYVDVTSSCYVGGSQVTSFVIAGTEALGGNNGISQALFYLQIRLPLNRWAIQGPMAFLSFSNQTTLPAEPRYICRVKVHTGLKSTWLSIQGFLEKSLKIKFALKKYWKSTLMPWKVLEFYYFL